MSLTSGRTAIEAYLQAQWVSAVPMGMDGHAFTVAAPSIRMTITEGAVLQGSIGRTLNQVHQIGLVTFQIFTAGGTGSEEWRGLADTLMDLFHGKTLDAAGAVVTTQAQTALVRFSPPELGNGAHPYISAMIEDPPYQMVNVMVPCIRYELR